MRDGVCRCKRKSFNIFFSLFIVWLIYLNLIIPHKVYNCDETFEIIHPNMTAKLVGSTMIQIEIIMKTMEMKIVKTRSISMMSKPFVFEVFVVK
jgi:hypothetical protein